MTVTPKIYSHCPKKSAARQSTVINPYRLLFNQSVPSDQQYWSMCAACANEDGIIDGSELAQIRAEGFIQDRQFHGVDRERSIFADNAKYQNSNWYCDDFLVAMQKSHAKRLFNPAIINADLINMPGIASEYIAKILDFLDGGNFHDTMIVANIVLKSHNRFSNAEELKTLLYESQLFQKVWQKKIWQIFGNQIYTYKGTDNERGHSNTIMGSIVLVPCKRMINAL